MGLQLPVKISSVNNLSDARYCAGMGVTWIGFCLNPSEPAFLPSQKAKEIASWLAGVAFVGELGTEDLPSDIAHYPLDYLQTDVPEKLPMLQSYGLPLILRMRVHTLADIQQAIRIAANCQPLTEFFLLEGSLNPHMLEVLPLLHQACAQHKIILELPFEATTIVQTVASIQPYGIALKGGFEAKPGLKDFDDIAAILEALEVEDDIAH
ncbi:MAG: phosphoribosylanthranilate isomerase [Cytophagales bacterium]|nr:phosphoribosylanthranilate isomerase [Bernardetiaceae bacterium]MDW8205996.1 phosphoribosylanthranilate isomerase [Cytophagales bacterium]